MKNFSLFIFVLLFSYGLKAHQADVSTTMLVEKENGTWILQISSSLTAFQQEIRTHFAKTPYKTPEEFQQMVLTHIQNKFHITVNDGQQITFSNGVVKLGHETKVIFEVFGIPKDLKSVVVQNNTFKDIHRNQSALLLLKEGFNKKHFVLNSENNHTIALQVSGTNFIQISENERSLTSFELAIIVLGFLGIAFLAFKSKKEELAPELMLKKVV